MKTLKALLIEDEPRSQKAFQILIDKHCPQVSVVGVSHNVADAIEAVRHHDPELVFLDVRMPGQSGFDFLDAFAEPPFEIIFVTAYDQYAIEALRRSAVDYLLKPLSVPELVAAVNRAWNRIERQADKLPYQVLQQNHKTKELKHQKLAVPTRDGLEFVALEEVTKLQADRNYTRIFVSGGSQLLSTHHLKLYEEALPDELFFRTHHSFIINLQHVQTYMRGEGGYVVLTDGSTADISKRRKRDFLQVFGH